ncbi:DUF2188 domain-containing protein [Legionella sainthelensi]|uniref:DUF2188 domain-containing protein n=1 Tax=Legionella sainthelensi TaxID=28087 RepID=A0A2H5FRN2_9GAMM|nr:DUF2188 domain-containing protein [Legionella sainthelensi]AUH74204.1 DUF2188 domain-containing protein [Legionella sainthelensi]
MKKSGSSQILDHLETKKEAFIKARLLSIKERSELVIHGKDGQIESKDSHGHDPRNIKG